MRHFHSAVTFVAGGILATAGLSQAAGTTEHNTPAQTNAPQKQPAQKPSGTSDKSQSSTDAKNQQAPEGFVIVDEQLITLTANEPQNHFLRAKEYLAANHPRAAAAEVRIAAGYLDMQASRKGDADQQALRSESQQLRQLADQISQRHSRTQEQNGNNAEKNAANANASNVKGNSNTSESPDQKQLDEAFARGDRTLARHFQEEAKAELSKQKAIRAGEDLDAAAAALNASIAWSGQQCSKECTQAISDARRVSDELLSPGSSQTNAVENSQQQSQQKTAESAGANNKTSQDNDDAQPAGARLSGQSESSKANSPIPGDAEKAVDELGKAIKSDASASTAQPSSVAK